MEFEDGAQEPEKHTGEEEVDGDVEAEEGEGDFGREPDAAAAVEVAEFYNGG